MCRGYKQRSTKEQRSLLRNLRDFIHKKPAHAKLALIETQRRTHKIYLSNIVNLFGHNYSLRSGLTAYACSPRRRVLSCLRHFRESHGRASVEATPHSRGLTVATTARTTRFCRTQASRSAPGRLRPRAWQASSAVRTTRLAGRSQGSAQSIAPPCVSHPRRRCPASTAARSAVRDDVRPPLVTRSGWGDNAINQKFCKGEYFGM